MIDFSKCQSEHLKSIHDQIRSGEIARAQRELQALSGAPFTRTTRVYVANLMRRCGLSSDSIALLYRVVHPIQGRKSQATLEEKTEYAGALIQIGALLEAYDLLNNLPKTIPMFCSKNRSFISGSGTIKPPSHC